MRSSARCASSSARASRSLSVLLSPRKWAVTIATSASSRRAATRAIHRAISLPARWRLDHDAYGFPVELWLKDAANRVFEAPKPMVDAQQLSTEPVTC